MNNRRKTLKSVSFLLVTLGWLLIACRPETKTTQPAAGRSVTVTIRTGPEAEALKKVAARFKETTGIAVRFNELGRDVYMSSMPTQLLAKTSAVDVFFVPSTMIGEFAASGAIEPLDGYVKPDSDLLVSYGYQGRTFALPTDVSTMFLYYRSDLLPTPPNTWDDLHAMALRFSRKINPSSKTAYGLGFSGKGPEEPPKVFYSLLWSFGGQVLDGNRVVLDSPASVSAATYYQNLIKDGAASEEVVTWSYPEVVEALERGDIAMAAPMWNAAYADIRSSTGPYHDKVAVAQVPAFKAADGTLRRVNFQHGWTLVVNANSKAKRDAASFVAYATGKEGGRIYAIGGGTPARLSILSDAELRKQRPEFSLVLDSLRIARAEPASPVYTQVHAVMNNMLNQLLLQRETPNAATKDAAASLRRIPGLQ